jgi:hypothetical protein
MLIWAFFLALVCGTRAQSFVLTFHLYPVYVLVVLFQSSDSKPQWHKDGEDEWVKKILLVIPYFVSSLGNRLMHEAKTMW